MSSHSAATRMIQPCGGSNRLFIDNTVHTLTQGGSHGHTIPLQQRSVIMSKIVSFSLLLASLFSLTGCVNDPSKRTPGTFVDDAVLEPLIKNEIYKSNPEFKGSHIVVVSYNGLVLLAGQVATSELKEQAATVAQAVHRVRKVHNELSIGGPTSLVARSNDTWLTAKVKSRLVASPDAKGLKVKVVTENGVVYLMGLVSRDQADEVVAVTANVYGVQKIVKVFEYLD